MAVVTPLLTWAWPDTPLTLAVIVLSAVVVRAVLVRAINASVAASVSRSAEHQANQPTRAGRLIAAATGASGTRHVARIKTTGALLRTIVTVGVLVLAVLVCMEAIGAPLGALAASAGIGGVALGIGAQSLIKDVLAGLFMIFEDQFGVGDLIDTGTVTGTVEDIGLRVTRLRDGEGQVWYVRNGEITRVGNVSQGWSSATVSVPLAPDADVARASEVLAAVAGEVDADPAWSGVLIEPPTVLGLDSWTPEALTLTVSLKCAANQQWAVRRAFLTRAHQALLDAGVPLATPRPPRS